MFSLFFVEVLKAVLDILSQNKPISDVATAATLRRSKVVKLDATQASPTVSERDH